MRGLTGILIVLVATASASALAVTTPVRIVALGDSLTAGPGLKVSDTFPAQLEKALNVGDPHVVITNAGVSGDTSSGGLARLDWALADKPHIVIVELGANDGLRGVDPAVTYAKLDAILDRLEATDVAVLFTGMLMPSNMGDYSRRYAETYTRLAKEHPSAVYYPFFLEGVAQDPKLNLEDGMHPNAAGVKRIVANILPYVRRVMTTVP
ncbi:MAG: arylesterase [Clostridia bacterium]|nr:arylesterase [Deltaproteobacteria bacterium]